MANYLFFPSADHRQDEIWDYTLQRYGEKQARTYIEGLHEHLERLAAGSLPWKKLPSSLLLASQKKTDVYFSRYERHMIFFRVFPDGTLGVLSLLHEAMDIPVRLREDLRNLDSR